MAHRTSFARASPPEPLSETREALRASEERFRLLAKAANDAIWDWDLVTNALWWNEGFETLFGYRRNQIDPTIKSWTDYVHPDDLPRVTHGIHQVIERGGESWTDEYRFRRHDGTFAYVLDRGHILRDAGGRAVRMIGGMTDLTERKRVEEALRESDEKFHQLADNITDAFWIRSPDMREVHYISPAFERIWGRSAASLYANPQQWAEFILPEDRERVVAAFEALGQDAAGADLEYRIVRPDGEVRWVRVRAFQVRDAAGTLVRHTGIVTDITDRKRVETALQESEGRYRALVEWSPESLAVSRDRTLLFVNQAAVKMMGARSAQDLVGKPLLDMVHPDFRHIALERVTNNIAVGDILPMIEERLVRVDGTAIDVEIQGRVIMYDGAPALFSSIRDVTESRRSEQARKRSEAARKESEARYHALFNNMLEGYAYCRTVFEEDRLRDFIYLEVNGAFETLTGLKNVVGKKVSEVIPGFQEANRELLELYGRVALTGTSERCETFVKALGIWMAVAVYSPAKEYFVAVFDNITARKLADEALRTSMEEFRTLAEAMPQIVWITRPDGRNIYFNQQWMDYTGLTREESLDHGWNKPFHPDDQQRAWDAWRHARATIGTYSLECRLRRADGVYRWWLVRAVPLQESSGKILKWFGTCTDIHDLKLAQLEISRMNRALKMLSESNEALIRAEHEQDLLDQICRIAVESGGYRMSWVGYAQDDESRSIAPLAHFGVEEGFLSEVRVSWNENEPQGRGPAGEVIRSGQAVVCEDLTREPRTSHWLALAQQRGYRGTICLPLRDTTRTFGLVVLYTAEITQTSADELKLLQEMADNLAFGIGTLRTHARVREQAALLDIAHEAIQVWDLEGRIIYWNKGAERSCGWTAGEALGHTSVELLYKTAARFQEAQAALLADGEWQGEMVKRTKDGREIVVEARWTLVRDAQSRPKSVLAIDTDITEKKKIESQFLRAQRMEGIGTLAGGIAHDLNNVLAPIMMSIEMLKDLVRNEDDLALLTTLQSSAQRGADLVKQVLSFARGVEGQRVTVNPLHVMRDLLAVMRDAFPKSIEVRFTSAGDPWTITGDATQMHQVFLNLCVNARDAMPGGGTLTISMENVVLDETYTELSPDARPGAYVMVKVQDSGTGIPPEIRDRIFEPFFTTKEIGKGTGLGLSTTLAIVKSHGGFINLYSEMGKGTRFRVYLPANMAEFPADDVAVERRRLPRGHGETILLVDDEEAIRRVARRTLERFGYRVLLAGNGAEAVALYAQYQGEIAVVLTDMAMPIMDGPALVIALREKNPEVRIIGSSGLASDGGVTTAAGAWVHHYVPKPYTAEALLKTLEQVLGSVA